MIWNAIAGVLGEVKGIFTAAGEAIDRNYTSTEEKLNAHNKQIELENAMVSKILDHGVEISKMELERDIKKLDLAMAASSSKSFLTRSTRPFLVLTPLLLLALDIIAGVVATAAGWNYVGIDQSTKDGLINLLTVFGGAYAIGRSAEKGVEHWKSREAVK